jgi:hypothetical protein
MAGVESDVLVGYSMPAQNASFFSHTYVVAQQAQLAWDCFGRSNGGHSVVSGRGNSATADCLSYRRDPPSPPDDIYTIYAGIVYLVTGTCHQAANRILFPAQVKLPTTVGGYGLSKFTYGEFGRGTWREFPGCYSAGSSGLNNSSLTFSSHWDARSAQPMMSSANDLGSALSPEAVEDMRAFLRDHLARPLPDATFLDVLRIRTSLQQQQGRLADDLVEERISRADYLQEFRKIMQFHMKQAPSVLREEDFAVIFGEAGFSPDAMIDRDVFLAH